MSARQSESRHPTRRYAIAREEFSLPSQDVSSTHSTRFHRYNVGESIKLQLRSQAEVPGRWFDASTRKWDLHILPRAKGYRPSFRVSFSFQQRHIPTRVLSALHVAEMQGFDSGNDGYLWAALDVDVQQEAGSATLKLTINIMWNESPGIPSFSRSHAQQKLRARVLSTWFPEYDLAETLSGPVQRSPMDFYESAHVPDKASYDAETATLHIPHLTAKLYPFQKRAVQWLLKREGACWVADADENGTRGTARSRPLGPAVVILPDERCRWRSLLSQPTLRSCCERCCAISTSFARGILAEEMGLGKTLEIIALIILHQRPRDESATVFDPYLGRELRRTGATLIITPSSLLDQWLSGSTGTPRTSAFSIMKGSESKPNQSRRRNLGGLRCSNYYI